MSEFQGYAFQAVDRRLTQEEMAELRSISSRAEITSTSFRNVYNYGNFRGDVRTMMTRYFDVFVYVANWGTHQLAIRVPARLVPLASIEPYAVDGAVDVEQIGDDLLIDITISEEGEGDWLPEDEADSWLSRLLPVREALLAGDLRPMYLAWLAAVAIASVEDDEELEPPVPPGMKKLPIWLKELAEFLGITDDLLEAASQRSSKESGDPSNQDEAVARWVKALPDKEKDRLLTDLILGTTLHLGRELQRRCREQLGGKAAPGAATTGRTVAELLEAEYQASVERTRCEEEEAVRKREQQAREAAAARVRHLDALVGKETLLWKHVDGAVGRKKPGSYDEAVQHLLDLRDLAERAGQSKAFQTRLGILRKEHANKRAFLIRLDAAGLMG